MNKTASEHPITHLIQTYLREYPKIREEHLDVSNLVFQRKFGLLLHCPSDWDILGSLVSLCEEFLALQNKRVLIIFSSTSEYRKIYERLGDNVQYISWHEIFTGMHISQSDIRYIQRAKAALSEADVTFFVDPPSIPEVIDQVRGQAQNALVVVSGLSE